jgi:hypothetical protein
MRLKIMKCHIGSVAFYVAEFCKLCKIDQKYLERIEMSSVEG